MPAGPEGAGAVGATQATGRPAPPVPVASYLICTTPRTGSYLLCEALRSSGVAGNPTEYLSGGYQRYWSRRWGTPDYPSYLRRIRRLGTSANGVLGVKVHSMQFEHFLRQAAGKPAVPLAERRALVERWFPEPRYIWLRRQDRMRQAISYAKAVQTKVWWDAEEAPAPYDAPRPQALAYDPALIDRSLAMLERGDASWARYFEAHGLEPLELTYEDVIADPATALESVISHLGLELPDGFELPPSRFRRQADAVTEQWLARYRARPSRNGASASSGRWAGSELTAALSNRSWWLCTTPFRHLRAREVFVPELYEWMAADFRERLARGRFGRTMPGYDASALAVTPSNLGAFSIFASSAWRDLIARLLAPDSTGEVNVTLHHHAVGSASGHVHNDLNPGFFAKGGEDGEITLANPARCSYQSGRLAASARENGSWEVVERVRSVALLYYLANPEHTSGWAGATGLYTRLSDPVERPVAAVAPENNSLFAFECTPFSFHSFITNPRFERNCVVMWLHRRKEDVHRRWGAHNVVGW